MRLGRSERKIRQKNTIETDKEKIKERKQLVLYRYIYIYIYIFILRFFPGPSLIAAFYAEEITLAK